MGQEWSNTIMRAGFGSIRRATTAAAAIALGASLIAAVPQALAKDKDKEPAKPSISPEFGAVAGPVQKAVGDFQDKKKTLSADDAKALALTVVPQLAKIEGKVKAPLDMEVFGQWEYLVGMGAGDDALEAKGLNLMLSSGLMNPEQNLQISAQLGQMAYKAKDYPGAIKALTPAVGNPAAQDGIGEMLAASYESSGQPKAGLDALKTFVDAHKAAGKPISPEVYDFAVGIAFRAKLLPETADWATQRVAVNPSPRNWLEVAQLVRSNMANANNQDELDISRLLDATGALKLTADVTGREYVIYLQSINANLLPTEALRIKDAGVASGALRADDTFVKDIETAARPRLAADSRSLDGLTKDAAAAPTSKVAVTAGNIFISHADWARADDMFNLALTKGVNDEEKPHVLIRLGMAQIGEAKYADAKATLAKVTGASAPIAGLWSVYADQKAAGN
jgi:hypothetical protein